MSDLPTNVVTVRLRLLDVWGGEDVVRELMLADLETSERGVAVGPAFYPWRRIVSYEWEVVEPAEGAGGRRRQLLVRVLTRGHDGPEEHRVAADRFEVGPWTVSMVLPERVEPETQRTILRRVTVPWHRVLEYERMLAEATTVAEVPDRPDLSSGEPRSDDGDVGAEEPIVIDVAAVERETAVTNDVEDEARADDDAEIAGAEEPDGIAVGTGARVKKTVPRKTGSRRKRRRAS